jgi:hypothetical protein
MDAIDLASLDQAPPIDLDPSVWSANLTSLRDQQPELAEELEHVALPAHWHPVAALDGFVTYRLEPTDSPPQWLADTAAPATRARALLRSEQLSDKNPALPTIAAGAELDFLLENLTPRQAVFVFERQTVQLAAVLRTVDLAEGIRTGRCIFVPAESEQAFLTQLLESCPGLLPPGTIVALPGVDEPRFAALRAICEAVASQTHEARNRRLQAVVSDLQSAAPDRRSPRVALLALGPNPKRHRLAVQLAGAAEELGWTACCCVASDAQSVHVLPHCERLAEFGAELAICIDHRPGLLPLPAGKIACQWHLESRTVLDSMPRDDTVHLAATPRVAEALRAAGATERRVMDCFWACPQSATVDPQPATRNPQSVVLVADLPDSSATACRIDQPTHRRLWAQLHQTAGKVWETAEITQPAALLRNAERASGVELGERSLRERMCRIIEHALIPAVVLERILRLLRQESCEVFTVGTGWQRCLSDHPTRLAEGLDELPDHVAKRVPLAAIFAGPLDPLTPALFQAAALGWPLLLHTPGNVSLTPRLGGVFHAGQHYEPFAGHKDLRAALNTLRADPKTFARRGARTRDYLHQHHSYARRLMTLVGQLGLQWPGITT